MPSIPKFLMGATKYQYHGSGFGYECTGGWLTGDADIVHAYSAPLGEPLGPANETKGCSAEPRCCAKNSSCSPDCHTAGEWCVRSRVFSSGTTAFVNYSSGATCMIWADGKNYSTNGRHGDSGCQEAASFVFSRATDVNLIV